MNTLKLNSEKYKNFVENEYPEFLKGMIDLGNCKFKESLNFFKKNKKKIKRIGGSVEQRFVIIEAVIFNSINAEEYDYAEEVIKEYFSLNFDSIFIAKCVEKIKNHREKLVYNKRNKDILKDLF